MMNDELTTQSSPAPIVLKLKKYDDIILPHTSRLSTDTLNDNSSSLFSSINDTSRTTIVSPSILRVKLKKSMINGGGGDDDEHIMNVSSDSIDETSRPAKRSKKSSANDYLSDLHNELTSSQTEMNELKPEQFTNSPLVVKIRRDSLTSTIGSPTTVETESNRQLLLLKLKKNEHGELTSSAIPNDLSANNEYTNGHHNSPLKQENQSSIQPHITNMLSNLNDDKQWNHQQINSNQISQPTTTVSHVPMDVTSNPSALAIAAETHTKELLDEALDSVKSVLMQTFRKNLEAGGNLDALKSTLGSDEVAEVFLSKLRESLKRETISTVENELKSQDSPNTEIRSSPSLHTIISPIMNVVSPSPPSSSSPLPSISTIMSKTTSPIPSSPQTPTTPTVNNKRKSSNPTTNPNRFDGTTEEELAKRLLSDILQPNLDIVFVGINPSLYAVHKGHHYGGPGNHFWKLLHMSDLIPTTYTADDDFRMPQYGIGFTHIVQRPTKAGSDITKDEITAGAEVLMQKIKMYRPKIVAFNGRGIYEVYAGNKHFHYGKQPDLFPGTDTHVFVMPSSSARCSQLPRAEDKLPFYVGLRKLRDFVNGTIHSLNEAEITFPDIKIKDTDDVLQKTIIRISNKPFSELPAETLKTYGDKLPSGQMTSKYHSDSLTTQTMSILHNQQTENLFHYDQQTSKTSLIDNSSMTMNDTDAAVLAALANGAYGSSSSPRQSQTIYVGRQQQQQQTVVSLKNNFTGLNSRSSTPPSSSSSHTIHHLPQTSSNDPLSPSFSSFPANSQIVSHQIVLINPNEQRSSPSLKDLLSSQQTTSKQTFLVPTNPTTHSSKSTKILSQTTSDDGLYLRYEREQHSTTHSFHFSYIIDEYSSSMQKRLRYVSINDL